MIAAEKIFEVTKVESIIISTINESHLESYLRMASCINNKIELVTLAMPTIKAIVELSEDGKEISHPNSNDMAIIEEVKEDRKKHV